jgi:pimeloyl-ACP methyl ester carboxylesterase
VDLNDEVDTPLETAVVRSSEFVPLHVRAIQNGAGLCGVFLHGFGEGGYVWDGVADALMVEGQALVPDLRGHGESAWAPHGFYSVEHHAHDVLATISAFSPPKYVIVGHSMGAQIGLQVAARRPLGLVGLVLVDFGMNPASHGIQRIAADFRDGNRVFASLADYEAWLTESRPLVARERVAHYAGRALRSRPSGGFELRRDPAMLVRPVPDRDAPSRHADAWTALAGLSVPLLIVRGRFSSILSESTAQAMARTAPEAHLETIPMAGHGLVADNPQAFIAAVRPFLSSLMAETPLRGENPG